MIALALACLGIRAHALYRDAAQYASREVYFRVGAWIRSAACTRGTHNFLITCPDPMTRLPIEDASFGDDHGHALVGNVISWIAADPIDHTTFVRVNALLNLLGILAAMIALLLIDRPIGAAVFGIASAWFGMQPEWAGADVWSGSYGIFCLCLASVITLSSAADSRARHWRIFAHYVFGSACLAAAILFREPIGRAGEVVLWAVVARQFWRSRRRYGSSQFKSSFAHAAALGMVLGAVHPISNLVLDARNWLVVSSPPQHAGSHGIAHNLVMGLGTEANSFGVLWRDDSVEAIARSEDPQVDPWTPRYFRVLWGFYFRCLRQKPLEMMRIYSIKTWKVLGMPVFYKIPLGIVLLALAMLVVAQKKTIRPRSPSWIPIVVTAGLFYSQGVLACPSEFYLYAGKAGLLMLAILGLAE